MEGETMSVYGIHEIPLPAQILFRQGIVLADEKREEDAVRCFRKAVIVAPQYIPAYREMAVCLSRLGKADDAAACYQKLDRIESDHSARQGRFGRYQVKTGT
jgi:tetratricopeptide (TPR) repeat protein